MSIFIIYKLICAFTKQIDILKKKDINHKNKYDVILMQERLGDLLFSYESKLKTDIDSNEFVWCYDNVTIIESNKYEIGKQFDQLSISYKYNQTGMTVEIMFETIDGELCNGY